MLYELRIYETVPGKLPALHARFQDHTTRLFQRHGMQVVGFWTTVIGPSNNELTYMLAFADMGDRERKWTAFARDPEWIAAKAASEIGGVLVANIRSQLLTPTPYSPLR